MMIIRPATLTLHGGAAAIVASLVAFVSAVPTAAFGQASGNPVPQANVDASLRALQDSININSHVAVHSADNLTTLYVVHAAIAGQCRLTFVKKDSTFTEKHGVMVVGSQDWAIDLVQLQASPIVEALKDAWTVRLNTISGHDLTTRRTTLFYQPDKSAPVENHGPAQFVEFLAQSKASADAIGSAAAAAVTSCRSVAQSPADTALRLRKSAFLFGEIPWGSSATIIQQSLGAKSYTFDGMDGDSDLAFTGTVGGHTARIVAVMTPRRVVEQFQVSFVPDRGESTLQLYDEFKGVLSAKYGSPETDIHALAPPFTEGDAFEEAAIRAGKANYVAIWRSSTDGSSVRVKITPTPAVVIVYESPDFGTEADRRRAKGLKDL